MYPRGVATLPPVGNLPTDGEKKVSAVGNDRMIVKRLRQVALRHRSLAHVSDTCREKMQKTFIRLPEMLHGSKISSSFSLWKRPSNASKRCKHRRSRYRAIDTKQPYFNAGQRFEKVCNCATRNNASSSQLEDRYENVAAGEKRVPNKVAAKYEIAYCFRKQSCAGPLAARSVKTERLDGGFIHRQQRRYNPIRFI